jgi:hypothetical protein
MAGAQRSVVDQEKGLVELKGNRTLTFAVRWQSID